MENEKVNLFTIEKSGLYKGMTLERDRTDYFVRAGIIPLTDIFLKIYVKRGANLQKILIRDGSAKPKEVVYDGYLIRDEKNNLTLLCERTNDSECIFLLIKYKYCKIIGKAGFVREKAEKLFHIVKLYPGSLVKCYNEEGKDYIELSFDQITQKAT